jgi:hypothetical protein
MLVMVVSIGAVATPLFTGLLCDSVSFDPRRAPLSGSCGQYGRAARIPRRRMMTSFIICYLCWQAERVPVNPATTDPEKTACHVK